ncbi:hypothetical protein [Dishui Lake phycodnavirus 4]|nr:hypothetical protein [Dishui Lake phycodnavirus 4]
MSQVIRTFASEVEVQSLTSIVGGFSFAAAIAWMDLVRFLTQSIIRVNKNGGSHYALTALFTTILSILVFMIVRNLNKSVEKPQQPVYAVTR